jgi:glutamyl-tRNA synthetase
MNTMSRPVRVRFAPSPTGFLHVGGMRSALFNWLWARHNGGVSVLRMEDTDRARFVEGAEDQIEQSMDALGITPDEGPHAGGAFGPYVQSKRLDLYTKYASQLLSSGHLYRCWCSPERLADMRTKAQLAGTAFKYDRHCLNKQDQDPNLPHVLRFRIPDEPTSVTWTDAVRGTSTIRTIELDDFVAMKADQFPTYHFANVIDDHLMEITHVLRADEWLPSTPKHLLLTAALGWEAPVYGHLPAVLGPGGGKKLSKRDGAQSVQEYTREGFLPEALMSFLASLGWNDGTTQEVYTPEELIEHFSLDRIQKSPAHFDRERLIWMNGLLIRQMPREELLARSNGFWPESARDESLAYRNGVLALVQERLKFLSELPDLTEFFFTDPVQDVKLLTKHYDAPQSRRLLQDLLARISPVSDASWNNDTLENLVRTFTAENELNTGHFFTLIRSCVTGRTAAPGLFDTIRVLGKTTTLRRLGQAIEKL